MSARVLVAALALVVATGVQARDNILRLPVGAALAEVPTQRIVGNLGLRFGHASAAGADLVAGDIQVDGSAEPTRENATRRDSERPSAESVCQRAFDDAMTRLVAAAHQAGALAVVGVVSDYKGQVVDDASTYVCHAGSFHSFVSLRGQLARSRPHTLPVPAPSGYGELSNLDVVPSTPAGKERYAHFLTLPKPRAFVFLDDGSWRFWSNDPDAMTKALDDCSHTGHRCWLYAVDDRVVWNADESRRIGSVAQLRAGAPAAAPQDEHQ